MAKLEIQLTLDAEAFKKQMKQFESDFFIYLYDFEELDTELNLLGINTDK